MTQATAPAAPHPHSRNALIFAAVLALVSWASAYPVVRMALPMIAPIPLAAARYTVAAAIALVWIGWARPKLPRKQDIPRFVACGGIGITLYNILFNVGEQTVSAGAASFLISFSPLLSALVAVVFLGEKLSPWGWVGSLVSFCGVVLIARSQPGGLTFGSGAVDVLGAALATAFYNTLQKKLVAYYGALATTAYILIVGAVLLTPWLADATRSLRVSGPKTWLLVLELGICPAILGYGAWAYIVGQLGVARSSGLLYLLSPTTLVLAFLLTGEVPTPRILLGGAVILAGVAVMATRGRSKARQV
ncbi:DMT family transporter [Acetobacter indonesiensis]|uniref:DMT family transporter n=1 Tax=Acetobacter indonesiensis TaxID=104101 RepID=UPI001F475585|nr:DMT family transporter [Acetobacter indonesiensis]MCG0994921.1 DMT family transporter [Acetobacter indonesiensis]